MNLINRRRALMNTNLLVLPDLYQQVEYLESFGTQFINTGVKIGELTSPAVEVTMKNSGVYKGGEVYAINGIYVAMPDIFQLGLVLTSETTCRVTMNCGSGPIGIANLNSGNYYTLYMEDGLQKVNGLEIGNSAIAYTQPDYEFYLFGRIDAGKAAPYSMQISNCKISDNGKIIRNFIPCYRKSDNQAGLYDTVNHIFYINGGTGSFNVGGKV